jgi:O-methyltransferase
MPAHALLDAGWSHGLFDAVGERYLGLLMRCLTRTGFGEPQREVALVDGLDADLKERLLDHLETHELMLVSRKQADPERRVIGSDWPSEAETMIGMRRLRQLTLAVGHVVADSVDGDILEAGVWRGGACVMVRGALDVLGDRRRQVWVADSFRGLPKPDPARYPADDGDPHWTFTELAVGRAEVEANFARYGLLDERVRFLEGWFEDTLPGAPIEQLAVLRIDGDMYGSTTQALESLYPRLSPGGYCIIDDYGAIVGCRAAVDDFRSTYGVTEQVEKIDWTGIVWRKRRPSGYARLRRRH